MHFGEPLDDDRLTALLRPGGGIGTVITADTYGAGEADLLLGRALRGVPRDEYALVGAIGHDFYTGERAGREGLPALHGPVAARPRRVRGLRADGDRALARARRRRRLRPAAAAQPRPHRLHERGGLGRARDGARRGPHRAPGRRARPRQRLHARPDRLLRALRLADRLGDGDPQPARAVAGRARARRRRAPRRAPDHARRRLRRALPRRRAAGPRVPAVRPPALPPGGLGRARARADGRDGARSPSATG